MKEFFDELLIHISNPGLFATRLERHEFGEWWIAIAIIIVFLISVGIATRLIYNDYPNGPKDSDEAWEIAGIILFVLTVVLFLTFIFWLLFYITFTIVGVFLIIAGVIHLPRMVKEYFKEKPNHYSPKEAYRQSILNR